MSGPLLLTQAELASWTGFQRKSDIERWLRKNRVQFFTGKNKRICTTLDAINSSLYDVAPDEIEFV